MKSETGGQKHQLDISDMEDDQIFFNEKKGIRKSSLQLQHLYHSTVLPDKSGIQYDKTNCGKEEEGTELQNYANMKKKRKASFIQFQKSHQSKVEKLIRHDSPAFWHNDGILEEEEDLQILSSDVYLKQEGVWKNRKIISLTSRTIAEINVDDINKIKIRADKPMEGYHEFRVTTKNGVLHDFAIRQSIAAEWFSTSVWVCLVNSGLESPLTKQKVFCKDGQILKKSEFLGKWEPRYLKIDSTNGLSSSKHKEDKATLTIKQTSEIWTRFQKTNNNKFLVIKLWNMMFKQEFSIPINDCIAWLRAFCLLILRE